MKSFRTNDVLIRKFKKDDVDSVYEGFRNATQISNLSNVIVNESKSKIQKLVESAIIEYHTEEPIWALEQKQTQNLFGFIKIENYSPKNKICKISWALIDSYNNEEMIIQALKRVIYYLFKKKRIELVECSYYGQNRETDKILNNVGMKKEAVLKHRRYNEETKLYEDYYIYSIDINDIDIKNEYKVVVS